MRDARDEHAEAALQESQERLRLIIETAHEAFVAIDARGVITEWNPAAETTFGWSRAEVVGRRVDQVIIPESHRRAHRRGLRHFLATGEGPLLDRRIEIDALHRDGREFPVELTISTVRHGQEHVFNAFLHDISDRRRAVNRQAMQFAVTRALVESGSVKELGSKVLRAICEHLGWELGSLWLVDKQGSALGCVAFWHGPSLEVSEFESACWGRTFDRGVGLPGRIWDSGEPTWISDVVEDGNFPRAPIAAREGLHGACGFPILTDGEVLGVLEFFSQSVRKPDIELLAIMADIGHQIGQLVQRMRAEELSRRREDRFRALIERSSDLIAVYDQKGKILYESPSVERILGYRPEELVGDNVFAHIHPEDVARAMERLGQLVSRQAENVSVECRFRCKDGSWRTLEAIGKNWLDDQALGGIVCNARDITDRRELEEELRQAQKIEAIGRLAGGVAHDFNNALTAILGHGELLATQLGPGHPLLGELLEIRLAAERAASLTAQLLAFSRKQIVAPKVIDVNQLVRSLETMLRRLIGEDIDVVTDLDTNLAAVRADPGQLEQVIINLAINARSAMPEGGRLTITSRNEDVREESVERRPHVFPGPYVMLAVSDTGIGMDAETQRRVFEPFFTTKEQGKGTGLGLSSAYGVVKQSGGYIWLESEQGKGATFTIHLPAIAEAPAEVERFEPAAADYHGCETVLLVEDDDSVRSLMRTVLRGHGFTVLHARNGEEALATARQHEARIDLLLTDVVMPGIRGPELARKLLAISSSTRVIYVSGYMDEAVPEGSVYLQKPFSSDALLRTVHDCLKVSDSDGI